jgi:hypothetical protein
MKRSERGMSGMSDAPLRPIGLAMSAVVAGLSAQAGVAAAQVGTAPAPAARERAHVIDPSNDPRREEDASLILGPSAPIEPFADAPQAEQSDLFDL